MTDDPKTARLVLKSPHENQAKIIQSAKRFNHLRCGRRFGKTELISILCAPIVLSGYPVGIWYPTEKDFNQTWAELKKTFQPITIAKNEVIHQLYTLNGGRIDMWTMKEEESGQGFKYKRALIDESAKTKKLKSAWQNTIRPTLVDYRGDAFIMSRPKGKNNDFYHLEKEMKKNPNWGFFHFTSYDNPYLSVEEIEEMKADLSEKAFDQEVLAKYVDATESPFLWSWNEDKHTGQVKEDDRLSIRLSFDFNLEPFAVIAYQKIDDNTIHIFKEFKESSDIEQVCDRIIGTFGETTYFVTGDASGRARTGVVRGKRSYWDVVSSRLKLGQSQIRVRSKNIDLIESKEICNLALKHCTILVDSSCENLINQCTFAQVDINGILIKDRDHNKNDFLDTFRYMIDSEFPDMIRRANRNR